MFRGLAPIAGNTFIAMVRQPIYALLLLLGAAMIGVSPFLAMFAGLENIRLVKDMGLSTLFVVGLLMAAFSATNVLSEEVEAKTVLTLLSKPVSRWQFVLGKFAGLLCGMLMATYLLGMLLLMTIRVGVPEEVDTRLDTFALTVVVLVIALSVLVGAGANYWLGRSATGVGVYTAAVLVTVGGGLLCFLSKDLALTPFMSTMDMPTLVAVVLLGMALVVISAAALAVSTRWGLVPNIGFCSLLFLMGLMSDYLLGRMAGRSAAAAFVYRVVPNFQVFWMSDAVTSQTAIPAVYTLTCLGYGLAYTAGFLLIAVALFQDREVS